MEAPFFTMEAKTDAGITSKERPGQAAVHDIPSVLKSQSGLMTPQPDRIDIISAGQSADMIQREERQILDQDDSKLVSVYQETLKNMNSHSYHKLPTPKDSNAVEVPSLPTTPNLRAEIRGVDARLMEDQPADQSSSGKEGGPWTGQFQVRIYKHHLDGKAWRLYKKKMEEDGVKNVVLSLQDWVNLMEERERLQRERPGRDLEGARSPEARQGRQLAADLTAPARPHMHTTCPDTPLRSPRRANSVLPTPVQTVPVPPMIHPVPYPEAIRPCPVVQAQPKGSLIPGSPRGCAREHNWPLQRSAQVSRWGITQGCHNGPREEPHKIQHAVQAQSTVRYPTRSMSPQRPTAFHVQRRQSPSPSPGEPVTHVAVRQPSRSPSPGHHSSYCPCVMPKVMAPPPGIGVQAPAGGGARVRQQPIGSGVRSPLQPAPNVAWDRRVSTSAHSPPRSVQAQTSNRQA